MGLGLPILVVIPAAFIVIVFVPGQASRPGSQAQGPQRTGPIACAIRWSPVGIAPVATTLNALLDHLKAAFDAERSFAANAAHELRNPGGCIAQAQRLQTETGDPAAKKRAADIEATLKRPTPRRASDAAGQGRGARLRLDRMSDLRDVMRIVVEKIKRNATVDLASL